MDTHRASTASEVPVEKGGAQHIEERYGSADNLESWNVDEKKVLRKMYVPRLSSNRWTSAS